MPRDVGNDAAAQEGEEKAAVHADEVHGTCHAAPGLVGKGHENGLKARHERAQRDAEPRAAEHEHYGRRCAGKQHGSAQGREFGEADKLRNEAVIDDVPGKESAAHKSQAHEQEIEAGVVGKAVFSGEHGKVVGNHALHKRGDEQREKGEGSLLHEEHVGRELLLPYDDLLSRAQEQLKHGSRKRESRRNPEGAA